MAVRRYLYVAWLALTLNVFAPVFAYAHIHISADGEIVEHCAVDQPADDGDSVDSGDSAAHHQHHSHHSGKGAVPHCPYCPGFAAGASLAYSDFGPTTQAQVPLSSVSSQQVLRSGRSSVRIAQPRAPPTFS